MKYLHFLHIMHGKSNTGYSVTMGLSLGFLQSHRKCDVSSLIGILKYQLSEVENESLHLPYFLKTVSTQTVINPHEAILRLQQVKKDCQKGLPHHFF